METLVAELVSEVCDARTALKMTTLSKHVRIHFRMCWRQILLCHRAFRAWKRSRRVVRPLVASYTRRRVRNDDTPVLLT